MRSRKSETQSIYSIDVCIHPLYTCFLEQKATSWTPGPVHGVSTSCRSLAAPCTTASQRQPSPKMCYTLSRNFNSVTHLATYVSVYPLSNHKITKEGKMARGKRSFRRFKVGMWLRVTPDFMILRRAKRLVISSCVRRARCINAMLQLTCHNRNSPVLE